MQGPGQDLLKVFLIVGLGLVAACSPRNTAQRAAPVIGAQIEPIYVVTERELDHTGPIFGEERPKGLKYFRAEISVPPGHQSGRIEWPDGKADAARHFAVTDTHVYETPSGLVRAIHRETQEQETLVFIHGYNNTLSEAMYRLAQIQTDFIPGAPSLLFAWPSAGDPRGYIYDRDSVLYSRDTLEQTLNALTAAPGEKVFLLAHSVGAQLTMEVLRQAVLRGNTRLLSRISGVVLMSPDIDPDLFRRQAEVIGRLPQPFMIFVSQQDKALTLAGFLTGSKPRLGLIDGPEAVAGLDVLVTDFTALSDGEGLNHAVPTSSPAAISVLKGMIGQAQSGQPAFGNYLVLKAQP